MLNCLRCFVTGTVASFVKASLLLTIYDERTPGNKTSEILSDEGLNLETSIFESFTVVNLPQRPCS